MTGDQSTADELVDSTSRKFDKEIADIGQFTEREIVQLFIG